MPDIPEPGTLVYYLQHRAEVMRKALLVSEQAQAAEQALSDGDASEQDGC